HAGRRKGGGNFSSLPHRYPDRNRILPAWRDSAVCAAAIAGADVRVRKFQHRDYKLRRDVDARHTPHTEVEQLAANIVAKSDRAHPADSVLRDALRSGRGLSPEQKRAVSRDVFTYYRWFGWLDEKQPLPRRLRQAVELGEQFQNEPESFSDGDLIS